MKPRIKITPQRVDGIAYWCCEGDHPKQPEGMVVTVAFGRSPADAYRYWLQYWDIPF